MISRCGWKCVSGCSSHIFLLSSTRWMTVCVACLRLMKVTLTFRASCDVISALPLSLLGIINPRSGIEVILPVNSNHATFLLCSLPFLKTRISRRLLYVHVKVYLSGQRKYTNCSLGVFTMNVPERRCARGQISSTASHGELLRVLPTSASLLCAHWLVATDSIFGPAIYDSNRGFYILTRAARK